MKGFKPIVAAAVAAALMVGGTVMSSACTMVYVGKDVSTTGNAYFGRSDDGGGHAVKYTTVHPAEDHEPNTYYPAEAVSGDNVFKYPYPEHTYRYTVCQDPPCMGHDPEVETWAEVSMNENGVSVTATDTTGTEGWVIGTSGWVWKNNQWVWETDTSKAVDPLVSKNRAVTINGQQIQSCGIGEKEIPTIIMSQATSAKQACQLLGSILDQYGTYECNAMIFGDADGAWFFKTYGGHQYYAFKMPDDKVSVMPNGTYSQPLDVNDTENVIVSPNLISLAQEHGQLVTNPDGTIDIWETYGADAEWWNGTWERFYQGAFFLNPDFAANFAIVNANKTGSKNPGKENAVQFFDPAEKVSPLKAMQLLAARGEGSAFPAADFNDAALGNEGQSDCHIFEIRDGVQDGQLNIQWLAMNRAEFSLYLPSYASLITETSPLYQVDSAEYVENSLFWTFAQLNDECSNAQGEYNKETAEKNRQQYGKNVRKYWADYQQKLIEQQQEINKDMDRIYAYCKSTGDFSLAEEKATALGIAVSEQAFEAADSMVKEIQALKAEGFTGEYVPTVMKEGKMPTYSFAMVGGTGLGTEEEKVALGQLIADAQNIDLTGYTEESAAKLRAALETAQTVYAAGDVPEDKMDAAIAALQNARDGLVVKPEPTPAEPTPAGPSSTVSGGVGAAADSSAAGVSAPTTGDSMLVGLFAAALAAAGVGMAARRKKRK